MARLLANLLADNANTFDDGVAEWTVVNGAGSRLLGLGPYSRDYSGDSSTVLGNIMNVAPDGVGVTTVTSQAFEVVEGESYIVKAAVSTNLYLAVRNGYVRMEIEYLDVTEASLGNGGFYVDRDITNPSDTGVVTPLWSLIGSAGVCPALAVSGRVVFYFSSSTYGSGTSTTDLFAVFDPVVLNLSTITGAFANSIYSDLPEFMRSDDLTVVGAQTPLKKLITALAAKASEVSRVAETFEYDRATEADDGVGQLSALTDPLTASLEGMVWLAALTGVTLTPGSGTFTPWSALEAVGSGTWADWEGIGDGEWSDIEGFGVGFTDPTESYRDQLTTGISGIHAGRPDVLEAYVRTLLNSSVPDTEFVGVKKRDRDSPHFIELDIDVGVDPDPGGLTVVNSLASGMPAGTELTVHSTATPILSSAVLRMVAGDGDLAVGAGLTAPGNSGAVEFGSQSIVNLEGGAAALSLIEAANHDDPLLGGVIMQAPFVVGTGLAAGHLVAAKTAGSSTLDPVVGSNTEDYDIFVALSNITAPTDASGSGTETETVTGQSGRRIASGTNWILHMTKNDGDSLGTATFTHADDEWSLTAHGMVIGNSVKFSGTTTGAANYAADTEYYVVTVTDADTFQLSATRNGAVLDGSSDSTSSWTTTKILGQKLVFTHVGAVGTDVVTSTSAYQFAKVSAEEIVWIRVQKIGERLRFYVQCSLFDDWSASQLGTILSLTSGNGSLVAGAGSAAYVKVLEDDTPSPSTNAYHMNLSCIVHRVLMATGTTIDDCTFDATNGAVEDQWTSIGGAHGLEVGDRVEFTVEGTGAEPYASFTEYFVVAVPTTTTFQLSLTNGGDVLESTTDTDSSPTWTLGQGAWTPEPNSAYDYSTDNISMVLDINFNTNPATAYAASFTPTIGPVVTVNEPAAVPKYDNSVNTSQMHALLDSPTQRALGLDTYYFGKSPKQFDAGDSANIGDTLTATSLPPDTYDWQMTYVDITDDTTPLVDSATTGAGVTEIEWDADDYGDRCIISIEVVSTGASFGPGNYEAYFLPNTITYDGGLQTGVVSGVDGASLGPTTWELNRKWPVGAGSEYVPSQIVDRDVLHFQHGLAVINGAPELDIHLPRSYMILMRAFNPTGFFDGVFQHFDANGNGINTLIFTSTLAGAFGDGTNVLGAVVFDPVTHARQGLWNLVVIRYDPVNGLDFNVNGNTVSSDTSPGLEVRLDNDSSQIVLGPGVTPINDWGLGGFAVFDRRLSDDECVKLTAEFNITPTGNGTGDFGFVGSGTGTVL
jgi:hypothetical protein